jgi:hypothetical protein
MRIEIRCWRFFTATPRSLGGVPVFVGTCVPFRNLIDYLELTAWRSFSTHFPPRRAIRPSLPSRRRTKR